MATNLSKRLDRLERLAGDLLNQSQGPIYCREGEKPDGVEPERLVVIRREYVAAPERADVDLSPLSAEPASSPDLFGADGRRFHRTIEYQDLGVV